MKVVSNFYLILKLNFINFLYGYTADQVRYGWSRGVREALKLHKIRLPDFRIKEAYVTSQLEAYATGNLINKIKIILIIEILNQ